VSVYFAAIDSEKFVFGKVTCSFFSTTSHRSLHCNSNQPRLACRLRVHRKPQMPYLYPSFSAIGLCYKDQTLYTIAYCTPLMDCSLDLDIFLWLVWRGSISYQSTYAERQTSIAWTGRQHYSFSNSSITPYARLDSPYVELYYFSW
jgi:hypothetical protein